ncbi:MAG: amidohydrolase family protein [Planctomycetes bacterium]|nr:amidohydrolase family protein [Planctomycetota bacterium]
MALQQWNEEGRIWKEDHGLLEAEQIARCARAYEAEPFPGPVPTRMVSNGEYMPAPQTAKQRSVQARIEELADSACKKLGISRRQFLAGTGGMAASFLAMNEVFGQFFRVSAAEVYEPPAYAAAGAPGDLFVFDDQLHFVRGTQSGASLRAVAQGPSSAPTIKTNPYNPKGLRDERGETWGVWNPALVGLPIEPRSFHLMQFIKDVFLDSQVTVGLLSNVTPSGKIRSVEEARPAEVLTAAQTAAARNFINEIAGSTRMLAHGMLYVGKGNLRYIEEQIDQNEPDSWKGYNISNAAKVDDDPGSLMRQWRHDDEEVTYPTFELIEKAYRKLKDRKPGLNNICVHKGLAPGLPDPLRGHPGDLPKAARDWPGLNFITYHACIQPAFFMYEALEEVRSGKLRGGVPDISWTTEYTQLVQPYRNCYAEIGTTWASTVVTFPTVAAHIMGQLMKFLGPDRILFGSDSVWYGAPQWQTEAFWRFQIPEELRVRYGYPELTEADKRKILGLNSARLYSIRPVEDEQERQRVYRPVPKDYESRIPEKLKTLLEFPGLARDNMSRFKDAYVAMGPVPSNTRYGWIRARE